MSEGLAGQAGIHLFREPHSEAPSSLYMTVWSGQKESLQRFLYRNKIDAEDESAADLANHERFRLFAGQGGYPNAAALNAKLFYLPSHPRLRKKDIAYIIAKVKEF
jgi:dTDP-4-amino-4,6-dideoxygalactose transaminase